MASLFNLDPQKFQLGSGITFKDPKYPGNVGSLFDPATAFAGLRLKSPQMGQPVLKDILGGRYDPQKNPTAFNKSYEAASAPLIRQFNEDILPGIRSDAIRSGNEQGSGIASAENMALGRLTNSLKDLSGNLYGQFEQLGANSYLNALKQSLDFENAPLEPALSLFKALKPGQQSFQATQDVLTPSNLEKLLGAGRGLIDLLGGGIGLARILGPALGSGATGFANLISSLFKSGNPSDIFSRGDLGGGSLADILRDQDVTNFLNPDLLEEAGGGFDGFFLGDDDGPSVGPEIDFDDFDEDFSF